jgi:tetratricopeptide (TPR) repeat protein
VARLPLGHLAAAGAALHETGKPALAVDVFEVALQAAPGDPDLLTSLASAARAKGATVRAEAAVREAIAIEPTAKRLTVLACVYRDRGEKVAAERYFREALEIDPAFADAQGLLATVLLERWHGAGESDELLEEALVLFERAIAAQPEYRDWRHGHLGVLQAMGESARAAETADALVDRYPWQPDFHIHRGWANLRLGNLGTGFEDYAGWLYKRERFRTCPIFQFPQWSPDVSPGEVLVWNPEGAGDYFMVARHFRSMAEDGWTVRAVANETMARLFALCPGVTSVHDNDEEFSPQYQTAPLHILSAYSGYCGLPTEPWFAPDSGTVERWRPALEALPRPRVGVLWRGDGRQGNDARRSFEPEDLRPVLNVPGASFVSLQKGHRFKAGSLPVHDLGVDYQAGDWLDTAGVLAHLDLVITPCTGLAHLAGAMGVPTWLALSDPACWRWGIASERTQWYPTARLFRQTKRGSWDGVFERIAAAMAWCIPVSD